jgi:hypothetical protein
MVTLPPSTITGTRRWFLECFSISASLALSRRTSVYATLTPFCV